MLQTPLAMPFKYVCVYIHPWMKDTVESKMGPGVDIY